MSALEDIATALQTIRDAIGEVDTGPALAQIEEAIEQAAGLGHEGLTAGLDGAKDGTEKLQGMLAESQKLAEEIAAAVQEMAGG